MPSTWPPPMPEKLSVSFEPDLERVVRGLDHVRSGLGARLLTPALKRASQPALRSARANAPRRTGLLKRSLRLTGSKKSTRSAVGTTEAYTAYLVLDAGKKIGGRYQRYAVAVYFHAGASAPRMPLRPFIPQALDRTEAQITTAFFAEVDREFQKRIRKII